MLAYRPGDLGITFPLDIAASAPTLYEHGAVHLEAALPTEALTGGYLHLVADSRSNNLRVVSGDDTLAFTNGFLDIALAPGQTTVMLALLSVGDVDDGNQPLVLTATMRFADGTAVAAPAVVNLTFATSAENSETAPPITYTVQGDQAPQLNGSDTPVLDAWGNIIPIGPAPNRNDTLYGTTANDHLVPGGGINYVNALQGGNDWVTGGAGIDGLYTGIGNDYLVGAGGADRLSGGGGDDRLFGESEISIDAAILDDNLVTNYSSTVFADRIHGALIAEVIDSGAGDDLIEGAAGDDPITADAGDDTLDGGTGNDVLTGGACSDTHLFRLGDGGDTINNVDNATDKVGVLSFAQNIAPSMVGFTKVGASLLARVRGTTAKCSSRATSRMRPTSRLQKAA